ncbi:hypothetical protein [Fontivita pretiosa]|uniref:hypothetical protein n=1 Tax=Fontivita pretiosa TaxID=2989684 RepID=UPI003D179262
MNDDHPHTARHTPTPTLDPPVALLYRPAGPPPSPAGCNPFYLLSGLCMLAGLFTLNNSLDWSPLPVANLLILIFTLNLYEFVLIAVGVFLACRGLMRDATTLFVLEAFFLVDAGFLNSEVFSFDLPMGTAVNAALLALAAVKLAMVFRGLGLSIADRRYPLILIQMVLLLAIPGVFKQISIGRNGAVPALAIYGMWWIVGLIPLLHVLLTRGADQTRHRRLVGTFVVLVSISILAHLCTSNWVYNVRWAQANLAPVLLGLSAAIGMADRHVGSLSTRMRSQLLLPALAIILATEHTSSLLFAIQDVPISPLRLTLLAAALVYLHGLLIHRHVYFGIAASMCLAAAGLGHSPARIIETIVATADRTGRGVGELLPRSLKNWGILSVVASFALLAIGTAVSLLRPRPAGAQDDAAWLPQQKRTT